MARLGGRPLICLVTDRRRLSPAVSESERLERLVAHAGAAARAGVDLVQVRERDLQARELSRLIERCVAATAGTGARIVVNDRIDVAVAAGAHGVHLRSDSVDVESARRITPASFIVGRSVHGAAEAAAPSNRSADYLILGTVFSSASKGAAHPLAGLEEVHRAAGRSAVPVLAIGGITPDLAAGVASAGAAGIAAIGLFIPPDGADLDRHLETCVRLLKRAFDSREAVP